MKLKAAIAAVFLTAVPALHAFSVNFGGIAPQNLPPNLVVNVPGYGNVQFAAGFGSNVQLGNTYFAPALEFNNSEYITVTFLGNPVNNVQFQALGINVGTTEQFVSFQSGVNQWTVTLANSTDGAGVNLVNFDSTAVPEPTSAALGLLGATALCFRRRR